MKDSVARDRMRRLIVRLILSVFGKFLHVEYTQPVEWEKGQFIIVFNHSTTFEVLLAAAFLLDRCRVRSKGRILRPVGQCLANISQKFCAIRSNSLDSR